MKADTIPEVVLDGGVKIKIICGSIGNVQGPVQDIIIEPEYLDVTIPPQTTYKHPTKRGHNVFAYVIDGQGYFCSEKEPFSHSVEGANYFDMEQKPFVDNTTLVLFDDGDEVAIHTEEKGVRFLLVSGLPLKEPVEWSGPIVMNTRAELRTAFAEYEKGTFVKHKQK